MSSAKPFTYSPETDQVVDGHFGHVDHPLSESCDVLVVALGGDDQVAGTLAEIDTRSDGQLSTLIERGELRGKAGELTLLPMPRSTAGQNKLAAAMLLVVGIGEKRSRGDAYDFAAAAVRRLSDRRRETITIAIADAFDDADRGIAEALVAGAVAAIETQAIYREDDSFFPPARIGFAGVAQETIDRGVVLGRSINFTRRLVNEPPAAMYPESFADWAASMAGEVGLGVEVWDEERLEAEGCRAILAVGAASNKKPRLVILKHEHGGDEPPLAIVGKGVTFDSGGLSLKPSDSMIDMKCDMAGAATVAGVMRAVAAAGLKRNVIGFCGLAENMISGDAYKLGDVIETRSGKTVEIQNTDAEGRVVLADTLDVAVQHSPAAIVDLATLTGACVVALGHDVTGMMTNDEDLQATVAASAKREGEAVWPLPMFDCFDEKIQSKVADIRNTGGDRWGGAITAAKFLEAFVADVPWLHLDIAGPAFAESAKPHRDAGATGAMVRTLFRWIEGSVVE